MKILLTGANGMVGKNIQDEAKNYDLALLTPSSKELDLRDKTSVHNYLSSNSPDAVIHAAGVVGGIQANIANPVNFLVDNMLMGMNLLTCANELAINKLLNLSSSCMYPRNGRNPLSEDMILTGQLEPTNEGYALAKASSTRLCEYIRKENSNRLYKTIIPCNLYGKYDKFDPKHSHMIPAVIRKLDDARTNGLKEIDIWGDGLARREFMYAGDLAKFVFYALDRIETMPQNINAGLGHDYTINEYYKEIAGVVGYDGDFVHDLTKPVGMKQKLIDDTLLSEFGWKHETTLRDGLKKTYEFYLKEYKND